MFLAGIDLPHACGGSVREEESQGNTDLPHRVEKRGEKDTVPLASGWANQSLGQKRVLPELLHRRNK